MTTNNKNNNNRNRRKDTPKAKELGTSPAPTVLREFNGDNAALRPFEMNETYKSGTGHRSLRIVSEADLSPSIDKRDGTATEEQKAAAMLRTAYPALRLAGSAPTKPEKYNKWGAIAKVWAKGFLPLALGVAGTAVMALGFGVSNWTAALPAIAGVAAMFLVIIADRK